MAHMRHSITWSTVLAAFISSAAVPAQPGWIAEYTAEYEVRNGGRHLADAVFRVAHDTSGKYTFSSSARARGILRLARPDPAVDWSEFSLVEGRIVPMLFRYEDGSRKGEDNFSVTFDATSGEVRISGAGGPQTLPFEPGLLDRGSIQVALMRDLGACRLPDSYHYVDDDGLGEYHFERVEDLPVETGIGTLETVRFSQRREGSSRQTVLWLAPELDYLPVRIEQIRNGEIDTSFALEDVTGIERSTPACSGLG